MKSPGKLQRAVLLILLGSACLICVSPCARAQCPDVGTLVFNDVTAVAGKPFQATEIRTIVKFDEDGSKRASVIKANLFRDSRGRVAIERFFGEGSDPAETTPSDILIYDGCGSAMHLVPSNHSATVQREVAIPRAAHSPFCQEVDPKNPPNPGPAGRFDYLGHKVLEDVDVRGERTVQYSSSEAKLSGAPPVSIYENWCSTALDNLLQTYVLNENPKTEITTVITDIKREEPDPELFEIPKNYTIVRAGDSR